MGSLLGTMRKTAVDPLTALLIGGAGAGTALGSAALGRLAMKGTGHAAETAPAKGKRTRLSNKLLSTMKGRFGGDPSLNRKKDFPAPLAHAHTDKQEANLSYFSHPSIVAHELGHLANAEQARKGGVAGKALNKATNLAYSPLSWMLPMLASGAYATGNDMPGDIALGGSVAGSGLQLLEEGRASSKAMRAMKKLRGGKTKSEDVLPLAGGLGTYALGGLGAAAIPLMIREYV